MENSDELTKKVKEFLARPSCGVGPNSEPASFDDFYDVFENLVEYYGKGSDFDLTEQQIRDIYEKMNKEESHFVDGEVNPGDDYDDDENPISYTFEGVTVHDFEDLV